MLRFAMLAGLETSSENTAHPTQGSLEADGESGHELLQRRSDVAEAEYLTQKGRGFFGARDIHGR